MSVIPPASSGPALDRRIAKLIDGPRAAGEPPRYSTQEEAAAELLRRLEDCRITASVEEDGGRWYCVFWAPRPGDGVKERVASGSAAGRALAVCRAVLNLQLAGTGKRLRLRKASRGWIADEAAPHPAFAASPDVESTPIAEEKASPPVDDGESSFEPARTARES
jgi:hypothetical protein